MKELALPISEKLKIRSQQVETVLALLEEGATIPFIARYRKDKTGALDEVVKYCSPKFLMRKKEMTLIQWRKH